MSLGISYTPVAGTPVYDITITDFTDSSLPRTYIAEAGYSQSAGGTSILDGPAYRQKYLWTIAAHLTPAKAQELDSMFRAWDQDRSSGISAAIGLIDETFGATVNATALFSTPPSYVYVSPSVTMVAFGLSEV